MELILFFLIGLILGALSGLVPGLHPNLISAIAVLQNMEYEKKAALIVSMYSAHIVFSYIPSIFFGVPDEQSAVSVLPGQRMVREGKGIVALKTTVVSVLIASIAALILIPAALRFYPLAYGFVGPHIAPILIIASAIFVFRTKNPLYALLIFLGAGFFGAYALKLDVHDAFLPLFSGFFAMGTILNYRKSRIPAQKEGNVEAGVWKYALFGALLGGLANLIPAISSPAQVAALASLFVAFESGNYLATVAAIGAGQFVFAFASSAAIDKARHGVIVNLGQVLDIGANMQALLLYFMFGIGIAAIAVFLLRKRISTLAGLDFSNFNKLLAAYLALVVFLIDGPMGLAVFAGASLIGYLTIRMGVERTMLMGGLIVPTIMLLLGAST